MKKFKRFLRYLIIVLVIGFLFRNWLYTNLVSYQPLETRPAYTITEKTLIDSIDLSTRDKYHTQAEDVILLAQQMTSDMLDYSEDQNENDPNKLFLSRKAHCVGYATFCASLCNHLFKRFEMDSKLSATSRKGEIYFLGMNLHSFFESPFFKDHDYVTVVNKESGEVLAVDPTINEYLHVDFVTQRTDTLTISN